MIDFNLFREYDVRGTFGKNLTEDAAYSIGAAFGAKCHEYSDTPSICVAMDGRISSPILAKALSNGIMSSGANVIFCGLGPTPFLYSYDFDINPTGAVMVTGSHNPPSDNGFKFTLAQKPFFGDELASLYGIIQDCVCSGAFGSIKGVSIEAKESYLSKIKSIIPACIKKKVLFDPGFGATCEFINEIATLFPGSVMINNVVDGNFPESSPDPTSNLRTSAAVRSIKEMSLDAAFLFDGDGDRFVVIDDCGHLWSGDEVFSYFAMHSDSAENMIVDSKFSQILVDYLENNCGNVIKTKTGHVHIKKAMENLSTAIGGEVSGHYFFKDKWNGSDDGIYAALRFFDSMNQNDIKLSDWRSNLPKRHTSKEYRVGCTLEAKKVIAADIKRMLCDRKIDDTDGVRVIHERGWWLVRPSQTEEKVVIRWESSCENGYNEIMTEVTRVLSEFGIKIAI